MMPRSNFFWLLLLLFSFQAFSKDRGPTILTSENIGKGVVLSEGWCFTMNDSAVFSSVGYNDSAWTKIISDTTGYRELKALKGHSWFRFTFYVDSSLHNIPLSLEYRPYAGNEIFIDGRPVYDWERSEDDKSDSASTFKLTNTYFPINVEPGKHVISIRCSKIGRLERVGIVSFNNRPDDFRDFEFVKTDDAFREVNDFDDQALFLFFSTVFLVLTVFHSILFIYYRKNLTNLYYSIFTFLLFVLFFGMYKMYLSTDFKLIQTIGTIQIISFFFIPLFFMGILYNVFYKKLQTMFWILTVMLVASLFLMLVADANGLSVGLLLVFLLICFIETIRIFIKAAINKKDGANIFLFGTFFPIIGTLALALLSIIFDKTGLKSLYNFVDDHLGEFFGYSFLLSASFSMTLYLARDFARMNKNLLKQMKENKQLFDQTIIQEKQRKEILENQKSELERMVKERTEQVMLQKAELETKNRDIVDNLHYARRIQEAILPEIKLIYQALSESFIIYMPKDIVSGDFYSFSQKNGKVIIAAADCTGHGVTGAFMSMIGTSLLNQIINEHGVTDPSTILTQLNNGITEALKQNQSETEVRDGMDIALCTLDFATMELTYAGANRPLWLVKDGILTVTKADKFAIGGYHSGRHVEFHNHVFPIKKGDTFYIFTDGYADQFGGPLNKKFMSAQFRKLISEIQHLSMRQQEEHLKDKFTQWQGTLPQIDDVLVIGVRV